MSGLSQYLGGVLILGFGHSIRGRIWSDDTHADIEVYFLGLLTECGCPAEKNSSVMPIYSLLSL